MRKRIDELQRQLERVEGDEEKAAALNKLAWEVGADDPKEALALSQRAYELATSGGDCRFPAVAANSLMNLGRFHYQLSRPDRAQAFLARAQALLPELDEARRERLEPRIRMGMGNVCWRLGDYAEALAQYLQALTLYREADDVAGEAGVLSNLGMVYGVLGEYQHALDVYRQALVIREARDDTAGHGLVLNNMAMVYLEAEEYEQALEHACQALEMGRELDHRALQAHALDTVGAAYLGLQKPQQALPHFEAGVELAQQLGNRHDELAALIHLGQARLQQGRMAEADEVLQRALRVAQELEDQEQVRHCHRELANLYRQMGDYERALVHYEQFHEADRAIYGERADMRLKTLQVMHETETARKEAEIARLRNVELEREIAERQEAERALRESEAQFRQLLEELPIAVHVYDPDGTLRHVNRAFCEMWNTTPEETVGRFNLLQSDVPDRLGVREAIERTFAGEAPGPIESEVDAGVVGTGTGSRGRRWLRSHAYHVLQEQGGPRRIVILTEDTTERREAREALLQAQKMESLGALAGGVAHDFNNLLVAILGQSSLAAAHLSGDDAALAHVEKAQRAAEQAAELTDLMLAYSGRGHFSVRALDLNELIEKNTSLCRAAIPRRVRLELQLAPDLPVVEVDANQVQQLLLNLVRNAAEAYGQEGGTVVVSTGLKELTGDEGQYWQYTGLPLEPGPYVQLTVRDRGAGIAEDALPHVFDPFYSSREQGRGLGLAAVLGIVRGHGGGLVVRSVVGDGTTMEILWPATGMAPSTGDSERYGEGRGLVLVIDDEELVREAVVDILTMEDIGVLTAEDGYCGVDMYRQRQAEIGLVLLDLSMPGINGVETYRRLREIDPRVRVLLSSGYSAEDVEQRFDGGGPVGFLQKPYSISALAEMVKAHLEE